MAKCAYHAEVDAVAACSNCGRLVCPECKVVLGEKIYCNPCAEEILLAKAQVSESKPEKDTTVVAKAQVVESEPEKVTVTEEKVSAPEISSEIPKVSSKIPKVIRETSVITWTGKWRLWQILGILFLAASVISLFALLINLEPEPGHSKLVSSQTVNTLKSLIWWTGLIGGGLIGWATVLRSRSRTSPGVPFQRRFILLIPGALLFLWSIERLVFGVSPDHYMSHGPFYGFSATIAAIIMVLAVASGVFFIVRGLIPMPRGGK